MLKDDWLASFTRGPYVDYRRLEKALERIATVYDWHEKIPDDGYVGEAAALGDCIEIAEKALGAERMIRPQITRLGT